MDRENYTPEPLHPTPATRHASLAAVTGLTQGDADSQFAALREYGKKVTALIQEGLALDRAIDNEGLQQFIEDIDASLHNELSPAIDALEEVSERHGAIDEAEHQRLELMAVRS